MLDVLHLLDHSTPADAVEQLVLLVHRTATTLRHRFAVLGSHGTIALAERAGIPRALIKPLPSVGWADPTGWRALRRRVERPGQVHAWGVPSVVAATVSFAGKVPCVASFAEPPAAAHRRLLRVIDGRGGRWTWLATSPCVASELVAAGLNPERVRVTPAGVSMASAKTPVQGITPLRESLGIGPEEGPIVLLAGEGPRARHDHGLWAVAILEQLFPRTRAIVREDSRGRVDAGLERFRHSLPDEQALVIAPAEMAWGTLVHAADIVLATPDGAMGTGSVLAAMAAGVPVLATPEACMTDLIAHGETGMIARTGKPRAVAARMEEFMADSTLRYPLTDRARARVHGEHSPTAMVEAVMGVYGGAAVAGQALAS
jgi:hypothetical protein